MLFYASIVRSVQYVNVCDVCRGWPMLCYMCEVCLVGARVFRVPVSLNTFAIGALFSCSLHLCFVCWAEHVACPLVLSIFRWGSWWCGFQLFILCTCVSHDGDVTFLCVSMRINTISGMSWSRVGVNWGPMGRCRRIWNFIAAVYGLLASVATSAPNLFNRTCSRDAVFFPCYRWLVPRLQKKTGPHNWCPYLKFCGRHPDGVLFLP